MQRSRTALIIRHSFWLSLLLHFLFLSSAVFVITLPEEHKKQPQYYVPPVPAYVYKGAITPASQSSSRAAQTAKPQKEVKPLEKNRATAQSDLQANAKQAPYKVAKTSKLFQQSVLAASLASLKQDQFKTFNTKQEEDPILLIGDQNEVADPLVKLLGRALSANFNYPEMEGKFGIKGRVLVRMTLHPDGHLSDIQMVKSSENHNLDAAALYAANKAPGIPGADRFIEKPKSFVVGFVFY